MSKTHIQEERRLYRDYNGYGLKVFEERQASTGNLVYVVEYGNVRFGPVRVFLDLRKVGDVIVIRTDPLPEIPESAKHIAKLEGHRGGGLGRLRISTKHKPMEPRLEPLPEMVVIQDAG